MMIRNSSGRLEKVFKRLNSRVKDIRLSSTQQCYGRKLCVIVSFVSLLTISFAACDIQIREPEIQAVLSIKQLSDEDFQYVGGSKESKEDFRKVNFLLEVKHSSEMTDRAITVPMFHEVMNSYDTERYWYGESTKSDNPGEDAVYSNDIMFYTGGLDQEGMAAVFGDAEISITWTDKKGSWKEEIIRLEDIIKFE
jgi:hypothetical protein